MLMNLDGKYIYDVPSSRKKQFKTWLNNIDPVELQQIEDELNRRIDSNDIHTSSWIPGSNWMGTIYEPLYHACKRNETHAAWFFGLILYNIMINRSECWSFGRYPKKEGDIIGITYFRVNNP